MKTRDYIYILGALYLQETINRIRNILISNKKAADSTGEETVWSPEKQITDAKCKFSFLDFSFEFGKIYFLPELEKEAGLKKLAEKINPQKAYDFSLKCQQEKFDLGDDFLKIILLDSEAEFITYANGNYLLSLPNLKAMATKIVRIVHPGRIYELCVEFSAANSRLGKELFAKALKIYDQESLKTLIGYLEEMRQENEENKKVKPLNEDPEKLEFVLWRYRELKNNQETTGWQFKMCTQLLEKCNLLPL